jgi:N-carbamoylputrescine amidase
MRVTACQLTDDPEQFDAEWTALAAHTHHAKSELVLLPEMPFARWFASNRDFDPEIWRSAVQAHTRWEERVEELGAPFVIGTRPAQRDTRRFNEAFVAASDGVRAFHQKRYLPDEPGYWEASWYERGDGVFDPIDVNGVSVGAQICTELWMLDVSREYGRRGVHIIVAPRATPATSRERWVVGGRAAAIVSGTFCVSSNRSGTSADGDDFAGHGWIIDPEGDVLALTSDAEPFVTIDLDIRRANEAKATYPRYVR